MTQALNVALCECEHYCIEVPENQSENGNNKKMGRSYVEHHAPNCFNILLLTL